MGFVATNLLKVLDLEALFKGKQSECHVRGKARQETQAGSSSSGGWPLAGFPRTLAVVRK
jgi:hypothetical protein